MCDIICQNGGTRNKENCSCDCKEGYEGKECKNNTDECDPNPCQNDGTCIDLTAAYKCACTEDFKGTNCTNYCGKCPYNYMAGKFL